MIFNSELEGKSQIGLGPNWGGPKFCRGPNWAGPQFGRAQIGPGPQLGRAPIMVRAEIGPYSMIPPQNSVFRDPNIGPKRSPGQNVDLGLPKPDPWLQNLPRGMNNQKMRTEIPCRTPPPECQTEPGGASYGQKTFWVASPGNMMPVWGI